MGSYEAVDSCVIRGVSPVWSEGTHRTKYMEAQTVAMLLAESRRNSEKKDDDVWSRIRRWWVIDPRHVTWISYWKLGDSTFCAAGQAAAAVAGSGGGVTMKVWGQCTIVRPARGERG